MNNRPDNLHNRVPPNALYDIAFHVRIALDTTNTYPYCSHDHLVLGHPNVESAGDAANLEPMSNELFNFLSYFMRKVYDDCRKGRGFVDQLSHDIDLSHLRYILDEHAPYMKDGFLVFHVGGDAISFSRLRREIWLAETAPTSTVKFTLSDNRSPDVPLTENLMNGEVYGGREVIDFVLRVNCGRTLGGLVEDVAADVAVAADDDSTGTVDSLHTTSDESLEDDEPIVVYPNGIPSALAIACNESRRAWSGEEIQAVAQESADVIMQDSAESSLQTKENASGAREADIVTNNEIQETVDVDSNSHSKLDQKSATAVKRKAEVEVNADETLSSEHLNENTKKKSRIKVEEETSMPEPKQQNRNDLDMKYPNQALNGPTNKALNEKAKAEPKTSIDSKQAKKKGKKQNPLTAALKEHDKMIEASVKEEERSNIVKTSTSGGNSNGNKDEEVESTDEKQNTNVEVSKSTMMADAIECSAVEALHTNERKEHTTTTDPVDKQSDKVKSESDVKVTKNVNASGTDKKDDEVKVSKCATTGVATMGSAVEELSTNDRKESTKKTDLAADDGDDSDSSDSSDSSSSSSGSSSSDSDSESEDEREDNVNDSKTVVEVAVAKGSIIPTKSEESFQKNKKEHFEGAGESVTHENNATGESNLTPTSSDKDKLTAVDGIENESANGEVQIHRDTSVKSLVPPDMNADDNVNDESDSSSSGSSSSDSSSDGDSSSSDSDSSSESEDEREDMDGSKDRDEGIASKEQLSMKIDSDVAAKSHSTAKPHSTHLSTDTDRNDEGVDGDEDSKGADKKLQHSKNESEEAVISTVESSSMQGSVANAMQISKEDQSSKTPHFNGGSGGYESDSSSTSDSSSSSSSDSSSDSSSSESESDSEDNDNNKALNVRGKESGQRDKEEGKDGNKDAGGVVKEDIVGGRKLASTDDKAEDQKVEVRHAVILSDNAKKADMMTSPKKESHKSEIANRGNDDESTSSSDSSTGSSSSSSESGSSDSEGDDDDVKDSVDFTEETNQTTKKSVLPTDGANENEKNGAAVTKVVLTDIKVVDNFARDSKSNHAKGVQGENAAKDETSASSSSSSSSNESSSSSSESDSESEDEAGDKPNATKKDAAEGKKTKPVITEKREIPIKRNEIDVKTEASQSKPPQSSKTSHESSSSSSSDSASSGSDDESSSDDSDADEDLLGETKNEDEEVIEKVTFTVSSPQSDASSSTPNNPNVNLDLSQASILVPTNLFNEKDDNGANRSSDDCSSSDSSSSSGTISYQQSQDLLESPNEKKIAVKGENKVMRNSLPKTPVNGGPGSSSSSSSSSDSDSSSSSDSSSESDSDEGGKEEVPGTQNDSFPTNRGSSEGNQRNATLDRTNSSRSSSSSSSSGSSSSSDSDSDSPSSSSSSSSDEGDSRKRKATPHIASSTPGGSLVSNKRRRRTPLVPLSRKIVVSTLEGSQTQSFRRGGDKK